MVQPQGSRPGAALRIVLAHDLSDASELAVGVLHGPEWPPSTLVLCLTNDLIWWLPFSLYLYDAWPEFRRDYLKG